MTNQQIAAWSVAGMLAPRHPTVQTIRRMLSFIHPDKLELCEEILTHYETKASTLVNILEEIEK